MKKLVGLLFILFISISFTTKVKALNVSENDITLSKGSNTTLSITDNFDVGKKTLIPYLLDRGYTTIDYVMISHFDQDHVGGIFSVLEELK